MEGERAGVEGRRAGRDRRVVEAEREAGPPASGMRSQLPGMGSRAIDD